MTEEVKHLLGGYATGTLTAEESSALMQAALEDQEIFNAMADDEALRRYLAEPSFRQDLLKATAPRASMKQWAATGSVIAAAACLVAAYLWVSRPVPVAAPVQMAVVLPELRLEPAAPSAPAAAPAKSAPAKATAKRALKVQPALAVPPATEMLAQQLNKQAESSVVNGAVSTQAYAPRSASPMAIFGVPRELRGPLTAHITDINAAILTLDAGANAGVKAGDRLEILRENVRIGEVAITSAEPAFSVGRYTGTPPRIGDTAEFPKDPKK